MADRLNAAATKPSLFDEGGRTLAEASGPVYEATFSPDGKLIAAGSRDRMVRIWNASTGTLLHTLRGHTDRIYGVAFSPDGTTLAAASKDGTVRIANLTPSVSGPTRSEGAPLIDQWQKTLVGHVAGVYTVRLSPDGLRLASASEDRTITSLGHDDMGGSRNGELPHRATGKSWTRWSGGRVLCLVAGEAVYKSGDCPPTIGSGSGF